MKLPKLLVIGGVKWKIVSDLRTSGGSFVWHDHVIKIEKRISWERQFNILVHEICEVIMVNNIMRYQKCFYGQPHNGDYLFSFNHDGFEIFTDELSGILKQI